MKKEKNIERYMADELRAKSAESLKDWRKVDAMTDNELDEIIAVDDDERDFAPDWTKTKLSPNKETIAAIKETENSSDHTCYQNFADIRKAQKV